MILSGNKEQKQEVVITQITEIEGSDAPVKKNGINFDDTGTVKKGEEAIILPSGKKISEFDLSHMYSYYLFKGDLKIYKEPDPQSSVKDIYCNVFYIVEQSEKKYWYLILTDEKVIGWVNILENKEFFKEYHYSQVSDYKKIEETENWSQKNLFLEKTFSNSDFSINRIGPLLEIEKDGKIIEFFNTINSYDGGYFTCIDVIYDKYLIIEEDFKERTVVYIWDFEENKALLKLDTLPVFSEDKTMFYTLVGTRGAHDPYTIKIFQYYENKFELKYEEAIYPHKDFGMYNLYEDAWVNNSEILLLFSEDQLNDEEIEIPYVFKEENGKWKRGLLE